MLLSNWADILFRCSFSASFRVLGWIRRRFNVRRMANSQKKSDKKVCVGMRIMQVLAKSNIPANFSHHLCHHYMQRCRAFGSSRPRNPCNNQQMMKKNLFLKLEKDQPRLIPYSVANLIKKKNNRILCETFEFGQLHSCTGGLWVCMCLGAVRTSVVE